MNLQNKATAIAIFLIIALGIILYANSLTGQFIWDDEYLVQKNIYIRSWANLPKIFTNDIGAGGDNPFNYYRPLHVASYIVDYSLWGLNVIGYHLISTILHILVTLCVYWLILLLYNNKRLSLLASILFLTCPIQAETVASISVRGDLLSALFLLLAFIFYVMGMGTSQKGTPCQPTLRNIGLQSVPFWSVPGLYILALLSKENSLIFPALLLIYHYAFKRKINFRIFTPILIITAAYILMRSAILKPALSWIVTAPERIPGFFAAIANYLRLLIAPFGLHAEYGRKIFSITSPIAILGIVVSLLLIIYGFRRRKNNGLIFFSICWFFITLLPVSNIYPLAFYMAEHWLYLPSVGFFLLLAYGINCLLETRAFRMAAIIFTVILVVFYSYLTINQNNYWKEPVSFYERTLRYTPDSPTINNNLGNLYDDMGKYKEATALFNKAIKSDPAYVKAYNNLGNVYYHTGDKEKAIVLYKKTLEVNPNYEKAYYNLGIVYGDLGMQEKAVELFKKTIEINPAYISAYNNLGVIYTKNRQYDEAIAILKKAIDINPYYYKTYYNLSIAYFRIEEYELANKYYDKAKELGAGDPLFLKNIEPRKE